MSAWHCKTSTLDNPPFTPRDNAQSSPQRVFATATASDKVLRVTACCRDYYLDVAGWVLLQPLRRHPPLSQPNPSARFRFPQTLTTIATTPSVTPPTFPSRSPDPSCPRRCRPSNGLMRWKGAVENHAPSCAGMACSTSQALTGAWSKERGEKEREPTGKIPVRPMSYRPRLGLRA